MKWAGEMGFLVARQQKAALPSAPRDAVVPLVLRMTGSPAGPDTRHVTRY